MTVGDLVEKLKKMPQDAVVVIEMWSECDDLADDEPTLIAAEEKKLMRRNGKYLSYHKECWDPKDGEPEFVTVCHFPGN